MRYFELSKEEKNELRSTLWSESIDGNEYSDYSSLSPKDRAIVDACVCPGEIPEEVMTAAYGIYEFVEEDFFCNL